MPERKRLKRLLGVLMALILCAIIVWSVVGVPRRPPPSEPGYYTGPMKNKSGRDEFATDDGKLVAPPPGATTPPPGVKIPRSGTTTTKESADI